MIDLSKIRALGTSSNIYYFLLFLSSCLIAFYLGYLYPRAVSAAPYPIQFIPDSNISVPFLTVLGLENEHLYVRTAEHALRFSLKETIYTAPPHTEFFIPLMPYHTTGKETPLAESCPFVATATGKYVYTAGTKKAEAITKGKRCFTTIEEAQAKGLTLYEEKK